MKTIIIGQQPAKHEDEGVTLPFGPNTSGARLASMTGVTYRAFRQGFDLINLSQFHDPDGFSPEYHRNSFLNLVPLLQGRQVIMLGPAVAKACMISRNEIPAWGEYFDHPRAEFIMLVSVIPHPSGLNRLYNDPAITEVVSQCLSFSFQSDNGSYLGSVAVSS